MGYDLRIHVEVKFNDKWEHYNHITIGHSAVAELMSEVSNSLLCLPDDVNFITKLHNDEWVADGYVHGCLTIEEARQIEEWYKEQSGNEDVAPLFGYVFGNYIYNPPSHMVDQGLQDARIIFWFYSCRLMQEMEDE